MFSSAASEGWLRDYPLNWSDNIKMPSSSESKHQSYHHGRSMWLNKEENFNSWWTQVLRWDRQRDECPSEWDYASLWTEPIQRRNPGHWISWIRISLKKDRIWWPKWIWMALGCLISLSSWPWWATRYHRQILHIQYIQPTHQTYETTRANKVARIRGKMAGLCWLLLGTLALTLDQS